MMYRKHYNAIAAALRSGNASETCVVAVAHALKAEYTSFDWERFCKKSLEGKTQEQRAEAFKNDLKRNPQRLLRQAEKRSLKSAITE